MADFWKDLGKKNVKVFDNQQEIDRKRREEERKRREANKSSMFSKLRGMISGPSLAEKATQAKKDVSKSGFWEK